MNGSSSSQSTGNPIFDVLNKNTLINSASTSVRNLYDTSLNNQNLYIGLIAVIFITVLLAYVLYSYLGSMLFAKIRSVVSDTKVPVVGTKLAKFSADLAVNANGSRKSFSFWVYINDMTKYKGQFQTIAAVSSYADKEYKIETCSPYIFLDKTNNSMYIRFAKIDNIEDSYINSKNINNLGGLHWFLTTGISINYVPLQRWVHIAVVCNSNAFKTTLYAYLDGELVKTISDGETFKLPGYENIYITNPNDECCR